MYTNIGRRGPSATSHAN